MGRLSLAPHTGLYLVLLPPNGTFYDSKYELTAHWARNRAIVVGCSAAFNSSSVSLRLSSLAIIDFRGKFAKCFLPIYSFVLSMLETLFQQGHNGQQTRQAHKFNKKYLWSKEMWLIELRENLVELLSVRGIPYLSLHNASSKLPGDL